MGERAVSRLHVGPSRYGARGIRIAGGGVRGAQSGNGGRRGRKNVVGPGPGVPRGRIVIVHGERLRSRRRRRPLPRFFGIRILLPPGVSSSGVVVVPRGGASVPSRPVDFDVLLVPPMVGVPIDGREGHRFHINGRSTVGRDADPKIGRRGRCESGSRFAHAAVEEFRVRWTEGGHGSVRRRREEVRVRGGTGGGAGVSGGEIRSGDAGLCGPQGAGDLEPRMEGTSPTGTSPRLVPPRGDT
mmetsp:Transcript_4885/g.13908  ORF Transcript_4885/g.13908 Transcript_4885/m.13908 type:complete len:242 (+) Transcript_4885:811-1536(+)